MGQEMDEKKAYVNEIKRARGYIGGLHKTLVAEDFEYAKKYIGMSEVAYTNARLLDRKTKEFIIIGIQCARLAPVDSIRTHIEQALKAGATKKELLEVLELISFPCGGLSLGSGFQALEQAVEMETIEPDD